MKRGLLAGLLAIAILAGAAIETGFAEGTAAFQLALFNPVQLRDESLSIMVLRLNLIYGSNVSVQGFDLGLVNRCTGGTSVGLQWGGVGYVQGSFAGWQNNFIDIVKERFTGLQSGFYNQMGSGEAVQWGALNVANEVNGLQVGFVNYTQRMHGLQLGILNIIKQKEKLPVLPLVNWQF